MKKLMVLATVAALALGVRAEYLYFMSHSWTPEGPVANFDYVQVGVAKDGLTNWGAGESQVYLTISPTYGSSASASEYLAGSSLGSYTVAGPAWADVTDYKDSQYTFYIETYKSGSTSPVWSYDSTTAMGYEALLAQDHIYVNDASLQSITPWMAIPEPTSGVMLLVGAALLALRRKQHKVEVEV